ncbi:hypothetical protein GIB67_021233 [Kingdonia uniflora]|uniref:Uncharacterized protein n=1 Tax=Kingdonia uniflora TaxID=39325 RepID=A0A7J7LFK6_9MAGN|nr:hypothetical protein GIB67_021233 [Kingdonia uniflora]
MGQGYMITLSGNPSELWVPVLSVLLLQHLLVMSLNGAVVGTVTVDARANQCAVLSDEVVVSLILFRPCVSEVEGFCCRMLIRSRSFVRYRRFISKGSLGSLFYGLNGIQYIRIGYEVGFGCLSKDTSGHAINIRDILDALAEERHRCQLHQEREEHRQEVKVERKRHLDNADRQYRALNDLRNTARELQRCQPQDAPLPSPAPSPSCVSSRAWLGPQPHLELPPVHLGVEGAPPTTLPTGSINLSMHPTKVSSISTLRTIRQPQLRPA